MVRAGSVGRIGRPSTPKDRRATCNEPRAAHRLRMAARTRAWAAPLGCSLEPQSRILSLFPLWITCIGAVVSHTRLPTDRLREQWGRSGGEGHSMATTRGVAPTQERSVPTEPLPVRVGALLALGLVIGVLAALWRASPQEWAHLANGSALGRARRRSERLADKGSSRQSLPCSGSPGPARLCLCVGTVRRGRRRPRLPLLVPRSCVARWHCHGPFGITLR